jgi:hypothetical protein
LLEASSNEGDGRRFLVNAHTFSGSLLLAVTLATGSVACGGRSESSGAAAADVTVDNNDTFAAKLRAVTVGLHLKVESDLPFQRQDGTPPTWKASTQVRIETQMRLPMAQSTYLFDVMKCDFSYPDPGDQTHDVSLSTGETFLVEQLDLIQGDDPVVAEFKLTLNENSGGKGENRSLNTVCTLNGHQPYLSFVAYSGYLDTPIWLAK